MTGERQHETPPVCTWQPHPGWKLGHPCPECGHLDIAHCGVEACPVCELLALRDQLAEMTTPGYWREQAREHGMRWPF